MSSSQSLDIPDDPSSVIDFVDNSSISNTKSVYKVIQIDVEKAVDSWKTSLFSYEWVIRGEFKSLDELQPKDRERRLEVEKHIKDNKALEKPILGMGVLDNVEIGSGRSVFLTLAVLGAKMIPVHIPIGQADFFEKFKA